MTLYFENPVNFPHAGAVTTNGVWHSVSPLLAISSYSQEKGGFVMIFDELGEPLNDINYPSHTVSQVTALAWHPERNILASGWENGELKVWNGCDKEFENIGGLHKAPITLLQFSEKGGRLVSCDSAGSLVGWKIDSKGQIVTVYHHDFKETITHLTFCLTIKSRSEYDIEGLAKAAVNGDEHALDMFSNWRPKTTARKYRASNGTDNHCFYVGTQNGCVYYLNQSGECIEVLNTDGTGLTAIMHHPSKDAIVIMMEGLTIGYFSVDCKGRLTELSKVKLSGRFQGNYGVSNQGLVWAGTNSLAILTGDLTVRVWNIETNDNYVLPTTQKIYNNEEKSSSLNEMFTCISYSAMNQTLCAGTNIGRLYFWTRKREKQKSENLEDTWELTNVNNIGGTVKQLMWGSVHLRSPLLSVNCVTTVYVMKEQSLCASFSERIWAVQKTASKVLLECEDCNYLLKLDLQVTGMSINTNYFAVTNGRTISVHEIIWNNSSTTTKFELNSRLSKASEDVSDISVKFVGSFSCENEHILMYRKTVIALSSRNVVIKSTTGITIATIPHIAIEGEPITMDLNADFLTISTLEGFLRIYDLSEHNLKLVTPVRNLCDICSDFGEIIQATTNSSGNKVAFTLAAANLIPDGRLYIWDIEQDGLVSYDFHKYGDYVIDDGLEDIEQIVDEDTKSEGPNAGSSLAAFNDICWNRIPLSVHWAVDDPRLLVCNAKKLKIDAEKDVETNGGNTALRDEDYIIITMFASTEHGICIQDVRAADAETKLLAVCTPYIVVLNKLQIVKLIMSDFVGLEKCNKATRDAILDFSYNLSLGNMDAAFKAIKLVQNVGVWNSLAKMCVKTRRLDVAGVCLGHMANAGAARAVRLAINDESLPLEAKLAVLAIQLDMLDEAEQLYIQCGRYDLLNKLLQNRNKFEEAEKLAESKDRIHLKNTLHEWGHSLELDGEYKEAAAKYEKANTHRYDVPRMLISQPELLDAYMSKTNDPELLKWWGQYFESQGNMKVALKIYASVGDIYSQVRVLCYLGEESEAASLVRSGNDKLAYCHMARHYETVGNIQEAAAFFIKANAYSNAVRLCKEHHLVEDLWNVGMVAGYREKLECAKYFEEMGSPEKAAILYHRAGVLLRALDLAFKAKRYDTVLEIATDLDEDSDPVLIKKCADYFIANEQFDKAVDLLAVGKKYTEAIDICLKNNVQLSDDLSEKLTPEKGQVDEEMRLSILENLAESLMLQGNYHLATKKFTQAGDKVRAMKALLKSGDTEKIIFFAGVSRQKEIYIMAANYLQSLDWQDKPEILRNIITFYSKGKALDLLANFYVACAQVEIDEFQNYEKAFGAITEASRCLAKVTNPTDLIQHRRATEIVQQRLSSIKRFIDIRRIFERGDTQTGLSQCRQLLVSGGSTLEESVRRGDIYAVMIQNCLKDGNYVEAKKMFDELQQLLKGTNTPITYYLNKDSLESLCHGLKIPLSSLVPSAVKRRSSRTEDEEADERVNEEEIL